jgi:hypothetical protein
MACARVQEVVKLASWFQRGMANGSDWAHVRTSLFFVLLDANAEGSPELFDAMEAELVPQVAYIPPMPLAAYSPSLSIETALKSPKWRRLLRRSVTLSTSEFDAAYILRALGVWAPEAAAVAETNRQRNATDAEAGPAESTPPQLGPALAKAGAAASAVSLACGALWLCRRWLLYPLLVGSLLGYSWLVAGGMMAVVGEDSGWAGPDGSLIERYFLESADEQYNGEIAVIAALNVAGWLALALMNTVATSPARHCCTANLLALLCSAVFGAAVWAVTWLHDERKTPSFDEV